MNPARIQIRKILDYQTGLAKRDFEERRGAIYADHSAKGCLQSGSTIRAVIRHMESVGSTLVSDSVEKVSPVARDIEAFADLASSLQDFWSFLESELHSSVNIAYGRHMHDLREDSASHAAKQLFEKSRKLVKSKLELYRFTFTKPADAAGRSNGISPSVSQGPPINVAKKGGRPPAEFWDDMWAAIAVSMYSGDFQPKSQADVQRAMLEWIEGNGHSAADSTVKGRARRLWDRIVALEE